MTGRPQGGMKSEAGRAAYWRMHYEAAQGALADLIAEHRELVEGVEAVIRDRYDGDFAPLLPKLQRLLGSEDGGRLGGPPDPL